jgi:hypothetical protein
MIEALFGESQPPNQNAERKKRYLLLVTGYCGTDRPAGFEERHAGGMA